MFLFYRFCAKNSVSCKIKCNENAVKMHCFSVTVFNQVFITRLYTFVTGSVTCQRSLTFKNQKIFSIFQNFDLKKKNSTKNEKKMQNKLHKLHASYNLVGIFILQTKNHGGKGCRRKIRKINFAFFSAKPVFLAQKQFMVRAIFAFFLRFFRFFRFLR
tara:strand:- start:377 stop:850 length:474 start_codon:yes stop_codon:yes gene_type:complete